MGHPTPANLENTLKQLEDYPHIRGFNMCDNWQFFLTSESYAAVGKKYLNQDLTTVKEIIVLFVNCTYLSLRMLTFDDFKDYFEEVSKNIRLEACMMS